jgi:hypothetical protein
MVDPFESENAAGGSGFETGVAATCCRSPERSDSLLATDVVPGVAHEAASQKRPFRVNGKHADAARSAASTEREIPHFWE